MFCHSSREVTVVRKKCVARSLSGPRILCPIQMLIKGSFSRVGRSSVIKQTGWLCCGSSAFLLGSLSLLDVPMNKVAVVVETEVVCGLNNMDFPHESWPGYSCYWALLSVRDQHWAPDPAHSPGWPASSLVVGWPHRTPSSSEREVGALWSCFVLTGRHALERHRRNRQRLELLFHRESTAVSVIRLLEQHNLYLPASPPNLPHVNLRPTQ